MRIGLLLLIPGVKCMKERELSTYIYAQILEEMKISFGFQK